MLKSHFCHTREEVARYINEQKIKREQIQSIVWMESQKGFAVFYWENTQILNEQQFCKHNFTHFYAVPIDNRWEFFYII